jgi:hypothetical protein
VTDIAGSQVGLLLTGRRLALPSHTTQEATPRQAIVIDPHYHLLPVLTTVHKPFCESVELARVLKADGTDLVTATPRCGRTSGGYSERTRSAL